MENYYNALAEVDTILDYLVEDDYNRIPKDIIDAIKENKSEDYVFEYDEDLELKDQELLKETRAILYNLFRDYLSTQEQREKIKAWQREDRMKLEQKKKNDFEYKELFPEKNDKISEIKVEVNNQNLVQYKKPTLFNKIRNWLKNIFR